MQKQRCRRLCVKNKKKGRHERLDFVVIFGKSVEAPTSSLRRAANDAQGCGAPTNGRGPTGLDIPFCFAFLAVDLRQVGWDGRQKKRKMDGKGGVVKCKVTAVARGSTSCSVVG